MDLIEVFSYLSSLSYNYITDVRRIVRRSTNSHPLNIFPL